MKQSNFYHLHKKYSHGIFKDKILEIVWTHSLIIKNISWGIAENLEKEYGIKTDKKLIEIGALIHDVGFYNCFDDNYKKIFKYLLHGKIGYDILIKERVSKKRARFALTHIGVGVENNIPISLEEEIVCYADNFHSKSHPRFNSYDEITEELKSFGDENVAILNRFKNKFGEPDLTELKNKYKNWHKEINEWIESIK